ncbi:MAG TPA: iron-containing alcohol dehydrogenase, partial [Candidatus Hydrogenedentes bacterium]|nr:iron-containing alcohol dehydrogenase [Candidatus Hydrogenedentota bacterium]
MSTPVWSFTLPSKVTFGAGAAAKAAETAACYGERPIVVTDRTLAALPHIRRFLEQFAVSPVFSGVEPNPTVANVDALAAMIRMY